MQISKHLSSPVPSETLATDAQLLPVATYPAADLNQYGESTTSFTENGVVSSEQPLNISDVELQGLIDDSPDDSEASFEEQVGEHPFRQFLDGLSEGERAEMREFHHLMIQAARNGELDDATLATLVEKAPAALQAFVDDQGKTLEEFVQIGFERAENMPPPTEMQLELREFFQSEGLEKDGEMREFFQELKEAVKNGQDLTSLTDSPQALLDFADHKGIPISELLVEIGEDMKARYADWQLAMQS